MRWPDFASMAQEKVDRGLSEAASFEAARWERFEALAFKAFCEQMRAESECAMALVKDFPWERHHLTP